MIGQSRSTQIVSAMPAIRDILTLKEAKQIADEVAVLRAQNRTADK
jgi:hypothetical protein